MSGLRKGTTVRDRKWGGIYTGTVVNVSDDGEWIYVAWHGTCIEDELRPDDVEVIR